MLIYSIGKRIEIGKITVGRFSPRPAQLGSASAQSSRRSWPTQSVSAGRCQVGPNISRTPPVSLTSSRVGNRYAPDPLPRPLRSNTSSFLCSGFALLIGTIPVDREPSSHALALPHSGPLLRRLAPSHTETSPRTTTHMCHCRAGIVTAPSELCLSTWGRKLADKPGTRQGTHAPPRLPLASRRVALHH
jgi:hypothetical protein